MNLKEKIERGLVALTLESHPEVVEKLEQYLALITKWNKVTNLTSIDNPEQMVVIHLLDSLSIQPYLSGHRILDVGSGAGLPGIPLALINQDKDFILLDSNGKKTRFMVQASDRTGNQKYRSSSIKSPGFPRGIRSCRVSRVHRYRRFC